MNIYIEADSIVADRVSGIGHATLEIIRGFDRWLGSTPAKKNKVTIIVPFGKVRLAEAYQFNHIRLRSLPPGYKYVNYALTRTSLPLPVDLWFGRGIYIFVNYKDWYVPLSHSIMFVQDMAFKLLPETIHPKNLPYMQVNFSRWLKRADAIVVTSKVSRREFIEYFPEYRDRSSIVRLGVNPEQHYPRSAKEISGVLAKYELPSDYFLFVSSIEPRKNVDLLLDAYKQYSDQAQKPAALVLVGGDGWKNEPTLQKVRELQAAGYRVNKVAQYVVDDDLPALYSGARALVTVPLHEGFGLSPLQAQACGTPVIASDIAVFKETLSSDNVTYVPHNKADAIAKAMAKVAGKPASKRTQHAIKLTWDKTVKGLIELIETKGWA